MIDEQGGRREQGYAMVALLVAIAIMAVALSVALPTWSTMAKREREAELIFRGEQYARAIALYQRQFANAFPPSIDLLVQQKFLRKKYRDPMVADGEFQVILVGQPIPGQTTAPQTGRAGAAGARGALEETARRGGALPGAGAQGGQLGQAGRGALGGQAQGRIGGRVGGGGIQGVVSKSTATSLRLYNGRNKYSEWAFVALQAQTQAGAPQGGRAGETGGARGGRGGNRLGLPPPTQPGRRGGGN
ncbi:MAG: type II secretion system protein [Vicinamibacterales bacterium]